MTQPSRASLRGMFCRASWRVLCGVCTVVVLLSAGAHGAYSGVGIPATPLPSDGSPFKGRYPSPLRIPSNQRILRDAVPPEDGMGLRGSHEHFEDTRCIAAGAGTRKPLFEYCRCHAGQHKHFSSPRVKARFERFYGLGQRTRAHEDGGADEWLDAEMGQGEPMQFLMLAMEREQLTKGRIHLAEAMLMAQLLNRTFVLTKVGNSRIGYDRALPFCTYIDTAKLGQFVDWVSEDVLMKKLLSKKQPAPVRMVPLMLVKPYHHCDERLWQKLEPKPGYEGHPLTQALFAAMKAGEMVCVVEKPRRFVHQATQELMRALHEEPLRNATVVLVFKVGDNMYFPGRAQHGADEHATFAPHLVKAARTMETMFLATYGSVRSGEKELENLQGREVSQVGGGVYLALQWRSEYALLKLRSDQQLLGRCVEGLLSAAKDVMERYDLSVVFLAADITTEGEPTSATLERLPLAQQEAARTAIRRVYQELGPKSWSSIEPVFHFLDNGIQGILDKLVCMHAPIFMLSPRSCGGLFSSFTGSIIEERKKDRRRYPFFEWVLPPEKSQ